MIKFPLLILLCCLPSRLSWSGQPHGYDPVEHARLYTAPDPSASGGLEGRITSPAEPLLQVLAIAPGRPEHVYSAVIEGSDRRSFRFTGLPMNRYDLMVIFETRFYEGLQLLRGENVLTTADREGIASIIERSEPFFTIKTIHRMEGETGRGGDARALCTFARDRVSEMYEGPVIRTGLRRTQKLVMLRQVGPGWQIARTRDLFPVWAGRVEDLSLRHIYSASLSGFRVTDHVRKIGDLQL